MSTAALISNTSSYWQRRSDTALDVAQLAPLVGAATVDAVVVGGGVSGLTAALRLRAAGASVVVLEAATIGSSATANGTGIVAPALRHWNPNAVRRLPPASRQRFASRLATSATETMKLISAHNLPVATHQTPLVVRTAPNQTTTERDDNLEFWSRYMDGTAAPATLRLGDEKPQTGVEWSSAFTLDPNALVRHLAARCLTMGVRIHTTSPALGYGRGGLRWVVTAPEGRLDARALFVATNASAAQYSNRIASDILSSVAVTDSWYIATRPLPDELRARIMPPDRCFAPPSVEVRSLAWTPDGSLLIALRPSLKRGPSRARVAASAALAEMLGGDVASKIDGHVEHSWVSSAAMTTFGTAQFNTVGPDGYAWMGGDPDDIALAVTVGSEFADAILFGNATGLALPLSEAEPIPYRRLRNMIGVPLLPRHR